MRSVYGWLAAVVVAGGIGAWVLLPVAEDPAARYRLASAEVGDVAQTLSTYGTVDFVNRADVSFGVGGTLVDLAVAPGATVRAGQRLAALDDTRLRAEVEAAEAEVASAKATLETDRQRQQDAAGARPENPAAGLAAGLAPRQDAVLAAQSAAGNAIAAAKQALAAQAKACTDPAAAACADAVAATQSTQDEVAKAQDTLQRRIADLATALTEVSTEPTAPEEETPTAATIAADQAAVDRAEAALLTAEHDLAQATLTAPIAGTVASVAAAEGDSVTAGDPVLVLIGPGAAVVETTVPVDRIADLETGLRATVTPTGSAATVPGTVTRIGRLVDESADPPAYPVTVTVEQPPATMPAGAPAGVEIVVGTAEDVLTVPTSAVTRGDVATVTVLAGAETAPREVELGAVGPLRTEIRSGLDTGEQVVLADLTLPLPSADQRNLPGGNQVILGPRVRRGTG